LDGSEEEQLSGIFINLFGVGPAHGPVRVQVRHRSPGPGKGQGTLPPQALDHFRQGHRFLEQKKLDEAFKEFRKTALLAPDSGLAYFRLGKVYFYWKDKDQAEKLFHKLLQLEPKNYHALAMLGETYFFDKAKLDQAQKYLQQALAQSPEYLEAHFHLGRVYAMKGEQEKALLEFSFVFPKKAISPSTILKWGVFLKPGGRRRKPWRITGGP